MSISSFTKQEIQNLKNLLELPLTHSEKKEVSKNIEEICLRDNISFSKLLDKILKPIQKIKTNTNNYNKKLLAKTIRDKLRAIRFPLLNNYEKQFQSWKKSLKLPPSININHSPNFEKTNFKISFDFNNKQDLQAKLEKISEILNNYPSFEIDL